MNRRNDLIPRSLWRQMDRPDGRWPNRTRRLLNAVLHRIGGRT